MNLNVIQIEGNLPRDCKKIISLFYSQADATYSYTFSREMMKLVLKEEELTGPFVMPHPFWTLLVTRWLLYLLIGFIQRENKLLIHVQWKVVLNLGVRLLPPTRNWCIEASSSLMIIYFKEMVHRSVRKILLAPKAGKRLI